MRALAIWIAVLCLAVSPMVARAAGAGGNNGPSGGTTNASAAATQPSNTGTASKADPAPNPAPSSVELENELQEVRELLESQTRQIAEQQHKMELLEEELRAAKAADPSADPSPAPINAAVTKDAPPAQEKNPDEPLAIHYKGVTLTPGGFMAAETVWRQKALAADVNTPLNNVPFDGSTNAHVGEFQASGRQSRISMLVEGKLSSVKIGGYYEADFLSAGTTSNNNQSNSYTLRQRQFWGQASLASRWDLTVGQMWSLATEYRHGLGNLSEAIPLTIDAQYNVGFTWARQYGFRATKALGNKLWIGGSLEGAQTLNIGGHNLPTIAYQAPGTSGGLYNPTANYSFNYAPDLLAKLAYEPSWGHFEVYGIGRFFRSRVFPNGPAPPNAPQPPTTSALGAYTTKTEGGGGGINARVSVFDRRLDFAIHTLAGDGIGRYSSSTLPDATAHPDGSLELLTGGSFLGSLEYHAAPRFDLYAYYGGEFAKRAYYSTGYIDTTTGQPILGGYGAPTNNVSGCYVEVLPSGGLASGPSSSTCQADTRNIQEPTFGYWFRFYKGTHGTFQQGIQYSYVVRHTWLGIGPITGLGFSPKAIENMWFTSFRYYLPQ